MESKSETARNRDVGMNEVPSVSIFPHGAIPWNDRNFESSSDWYRRNFGPAEPMVSLATRDADEAYFNHLMQIGFV